MKFKIDSAVLHKALDKVHGVVDKKNITPILSNIRLSTENNRLLINATDMDLDIVEYLDASIEENGSTTIPLSIIHETIKKLSSDKEIHFEYSDGLMHIKCGTFKSNLKCLPVEDFPIIQTKDLSNSFKINSADLKKLLEKTRIAISSDETRYFLNGIYLHTTTNSDNQNVLRAVATDGHRLALSEVECTSSVSIEDGIIIPKKSVEELFKLLEKTDSLIEIFCSQSRICLKFDNIVFTSKLIDGNFPQYKRVIPESNSNIVEVNKNDFLKAIGLISIYTDDRLRMLKINVQKDKAIISANRTDGIATEQVSLIQEADEMEISFNAKYINDICSLIKTDNILFKMSNSSTPVLIQQSGKNDELFVIMPMKS